MIFKLFLAAALLIIPIATLFSVRDSINIISQQKDMNQYLEVINIPISGAAVGPESFAFRGGSSRGAGGPYTGVSDGRIIKWQGNESRWVDFAVTYPHRNGCEGTHNHAKKEDLSGRPLGLCFNEKTGSLYIADAYRGLLFVGSNGGLARQLVMEVEGIPLGFTNSLDIDQNTGVVYFTDSSTRYRRRDYISVIVSGDNSGRLVKYDPRTNEVKVLANNLVFPNGVAVSKNGDFILVAETTSCRILKFWLDPPPSKLGRNNIEVVAELPGFPDNIRRNKKGEFWVAINSRRGSFLKWFLSSAWMRNGLTGLPFDLTSTYSYFADSFGTGLALKLNENGDVLEILEDMKGQKWKYASEVHEDDGNLWIGSVRMPFAVEIRK